MASKTVNRPQDFKNDFSNLPTWLPEQMKRHNLTVDALANELRRRVELRGGKRVQFRTQTVYNWMNDVDRPTSRNMALVCEIFGVPLEEGLAQYTPRKLGRPFGGGNPGGSKERREKLVRPDNRYKVVLLDVWDGEMNEREKLFYSRGYFCAVIDTQTNKIETMHRSDAAATVEAGKLNAQYRKRKQLPPPQANPQMEMSA